MELTQLRYFLCAAKQKHITKAADELHIAQPALTKSIHKLESELGVELFHKTGRGVDLTEYGLFMKTECERIISQIDALPTKIQEMSDTANKTVHIRVSAASVTVTSAIIEYSRSNPDIIFNVSQGGGNQEADIEVFSTMPGADDIHSGFSVRERIFAAIPVSIEKYSGISSIPLSALSNENFVCLMGSRQLRSICDKYCLMSGFIPKIIFESDNLSAVRNMISAKVGVGFWPEFSWSDAGLDTSSIHLLEITDPCPSRDIHITHSSRSGDRAAAYDFYEFLKKYFRSRFNSPSKMQRTTVNKL